MAISISTQIDTLNSQKAQDDDSALTYEDVRYRFAICSESPSGIADKRSGRHVGSLNKGWRLYVGLPGQRLVSAHRVVFMLTHKRAIKPGHVVVHKDKDIKNNSPDNLKEVSKSLLAFHRKARSVVKEAGYIGVGWVKRRARYIGRCKVNGHTHSTKGYKDIHACRKALNELRLSLGLAAQ